MTLPLPIDLTDKPFDPFNPRNTLRLRHMKADIDKFSDNWEDLLTSVKAVMHDGVSSFWHSNKQR